MQNDDSEGIHDVVPIASFSLFLLMLRERINF